MLPTLPILNNNILLSFLWEEMNGSSSYLQPSPVVQQVAVLQPHTSRTAQCAGCCPVILLPNSNLQSPSSTVTCSGSPTCTRTTFGITQDVAILGRSPTYLHTLLPLRHIFPECFAWWCDHSFVLSYASYYTFPHSGGGYQQLMQTLKNHAHSMVFQGFLVWPYIDLLSFAAPCVCVCVCVCTTLLCWQEWCVHCLAHSHWHPLRQRHWMKLNCWTCDSWPLGGKVEVVKPLEHL